MKTNTSIILLLLSVGLFYTFTNVQYQEVQRLSVLAGEYKKVLQNVAAISELRDRLRVTYETLPVAEIERINKMLPDNINTVRLALDLDSMASRYGISIDSIKVEVGTAEDASLAVLSEYFCQNTPKCTIRPQFLLVLSQVTRTLCVCWLIWKRVCGLWISNRLRWKQTSRAFMSTK